ncbi:MAG: SCP2 sterol-binding domain-containing protein [Nitrosomonadaceae bacterium]
MLASVSLAPFNHFLPSKSWAGKRLQPYVGKTVRLCISSFFNIVLTVQTSGELSAAMSSATVDTTITLTPGLLLRLLAHDEEAYRKISISGDSVFAEELLCISKNLHWDVEQDLSRIMGDILAHRVVRISKDLKQWHNKTIRNLSETLVEYWMEEQPLLAKSVRVHEFICEVGALKDDVEQLEKRVEKINKVVS